ncbi:MAG: site-specific integrase [Herbiconiux sp.]|uniref:site-specific integrase n=1 Tax=Herbiconiux sp. TaxID=1871186 RepID=UPI0011F633A4|nr:MAG: site-specific integrase [Herbiconiux sp.]
MATISSYATASGRRYRVRYRKPDHTQTDRRGFKTKREAELFAASLEVSIARGEFVDATAARVTVGALGPAWLNSKARLKPSSVEPLRLAWRLYVAPQWGDRSVASIRHSEVQAWVADLGVGAAKTTHTKPGPRGASTVIRTYGVLAAILDIAVKDRRIATNPARGVELPRKVKKAHPYLTHDQVELLASSANDRGTLVRFLAYTGLRWGEATALRVRDLDTLRRRANVRENAVRVRGRIIVGTPKSHEARSVPYPAFLSESLAQLCEGKRFDQLVFGDGVNHLVTPSTRDGWYMYAKKRARAIQPSFPNLTLHDLRHTAASLAVSAGANVKVVQKMLGHASAAMTLDTYADLFDDDLDAVSEALDQARAKSIVGKMWANGTAPETIVTPLPLKDKQVEPSNAVPPLGLEPRLKRF